MSLSKQHFTRTRLRLTVMYSIISVVLILIFSVAALSAQHFALNRVRNSLEQRALAREREVVAKLLERRIEQFDRAFKESLFLLDGGLIIGAAIASYVLSGMTLKPIRRSMEEQEEFAADVSHELRTPLTTISMEIIALQKTKKHLSPDVQEVFVSIQEEVKRMQGIVGNLLTLVRVEPLLLNKKKSVSEVVSVLKKVIRQVEPIATDKRIILKSEFTVAEAKVIGDDAHLHQLFLVLLDNALKYTLEGKVLVTLQSERQTVVIKVSDTGIGIPTEDLAHVFERFYRVEHAKRIEKGAGIGLAIAKKIVDQLGGKITVESNLANGTTFTIKLRKIS